ncbi:MAG: hypothetical protein ACLP1X_01250 [Polyangiaceae bacterium]
MGESRRITEVVQRAVSLGIVLLVVVCLAGTGCGGSTGEGVGPDASVNSDASPGSDAVLGSGDANKVDSPVAPSGPPCDSGGSAATCPASAGLQCDVNTHCPDGGNTSMSGTVYDPAGRNPLYNAIVFVPRNPATLPPIATGTSSCNTCDVSIVDSVSAAVTDAAGSFTLVGVPTGNAVPLVIQMGKWRRLVQVPQVADCADTPVPAELSRLPRNQGEGDMPQMALLTGGCDNFACFLRSVGVDAAEFSAPHAGGRVDVYQGLGAAGNAAPLSGGTAGDCTTAACPLWSSKQSLEAYDAVFLGCECDENNQTKPPASLLAVHDWLGEGGEVFATHSQATWFRNGPADFQAAATWTTGPASGATGPFAVDETFPKGVAFQQWLVNVGAADANGIVPLNAADVSTSVTSVGPMTTEWIDDTSTAPEGGSALSGNVKALSFSTPISDAGVAYCGRVYFTDIHAGGGQALEDTNADGPGSPAAVPGVCDGGPMTAEEKALEFLFFDKNTVCVGGSEPPPPPPCPVPDGG